MGQTTIHERGLTRLLINVVCTRLCLEGVTLAESNKRAAHVDKPHAGVITRQ
ncbi:hypothetical protein SAMN03159306_02619 [Pseudomonas sp. NFACC48-1]|nr:hypothetical protein SAMN03159405_01682 [Pseudomonas sp. NFACC44-2]SDA73050.1 hypothetical protein SAMN03159429_03303 [Pseudomonas sp. NFACC51]SDX10147.1 hypothetical protein SAMN03159474_02284 [Pseudomonas sp. NFACC08-1]SEI72641.1 hypothetical protein SAMN03159298_01192 [Pseudomonas sp. NFACC07-1]SFH36028.1 hypothetical protein SAMN03159302_01297 [Pseudomonas sp. NFACC54]SFS91614.1 hypothetical protein SAMN03159306_02619 [Pseudomonas sp. NFACC48-1]